MVKNMREWSRQGLFAKQKVLVTSKDGQTATGDWAIFDVKANTVVMGGDVSSRSVSSSEDASSLSTSPSASRRATAFRSSRTLPGHG